MSPYYADARTITHFDEVLHDRRVVGVAIRKVLSPLERHGARRLDQPAGERLPAKLCRLGCQPQEIASLSLIR